MSRSDWRARKVNVGSQHPAHTLRDDHDCGDVPPSPLLCDDVSPVDSMVVPVLQGHCNSNADSAFKPALDSKVALHSHPVAPRVTACAPPMCTASPCSADQRGRTSGDSGVTPPPGAQPTTAAAQGGSPLQQLVRLAGTRHFMAAAGMQSCEKFGLGAPQQVGPPPVALRSARASCAEPVPMEVKAAGTGLWDGLSDDAPSPLLFPSHEASPHASAPRASKPALDSKVALHSHPVAPRVTACASPMCTASPLLSDDAPSPLLFPSHEASPHALTPHEQRMISHLYEGAPFPLLAFHSDLESVRLGRTEDSLDAGQVFAESMIVSNIISALDQNQDPALSGGGGGGGGGGDDDDDDDDDEELSPLSQPAVSTPGTHICVPCVVQSGSSTDSKPSVKVSEQVRAAKHLERVESSFSGFKCGCASARSKGHDSCLESFTKGQLRTIHRETYGNSTNAIGGDGCPTSSVRVGGVLQHIHTLYFTQAVLLETGPDAVGRRYKMPALKLLGLPVCAVAFREAVGGSRAGHKDMLAYALRGISPAAVANGKTAKLQLALNDVNDGRRRARTAFARCWWTDELILHDWLPNENAIQFKGPPWEVVHEKCYEPIASAQSGHAPLKYKAWKGQMLPGARDLAVRLGSVSADGIRVRRSARHSNFPECTDCQRRRARWIKLMSTPGASQEQRDAAYADVKEHLDEWQQDRKVALSLKDHSSGLHREDIYECDDKCGSQWCELPVHDGGRDNKQTGKNKFRFGIQCNVVAGGRGVNRFMVVPKHIRTGSNFGLTCLLKALGRAFDLGRMNGRAGSRLLRHTDGGPDNLSEATHLFHWLLVWLGLFDEVVWFRFDAGHSHTELADRFFSMLKRLFTSVGSERAARLDGFPDLLKEVQATFAKSAETVEFDYVFANFDFGAWFAAGGLDAVRDFAGISFDNVFRYTYDESRWDHGCVKVTYKPRLSWLGGDGECEWSPFRRIQTPKGPCNVTTDEGVMFVARPPDVLRREPQREDFQVAKEGKPLPHQVVQRLVSRRDNTPEELSSTAKAHWAALQAVLEQGARAGQVADVPFSEGGFIFHGVPFDILPLLRRMRRFPRPFLHWDPFSEAPPPTWPDPAAVAAARGDGSTSHARTAQLGAVTGNATLRDPRREKVSGIHRTAAQATRDGKEMSNEEWVRNFPSDVPVETVVSGKLYLVRLADAEGGLKLGFAEAGDALPGGEQHMALWFVKRVAGPWNDTPSFDPYMRGAVRITDPIEDASFLLEVADSWLTEGSLAVKHTHLRLTSEFTKRLKLLATEYPQQYGDDASRGFAPPDIPAETITPTSPPRRPVVGQTRNKPSPPSAAVMGQPPRAKRAAVGSPSGTRPGGQLEVQAGGQDEDAGLRALADRLKPLPALVDLDVQVGLFKGRELDRWMAKVDRLINDGLYLYVDRGTLRAKRAVLMQDRVQNLIIYNKDDVILAFAAFELQRTHTYLLELHIEVEMQRKGLGTLLLDHIRATHVQPTVLTVHNRNLYAQKFYTNRGFGLCHHATKSEEQVLSNADCEECGRCCAGD